MDAELLPQEMVAELQEEIKELVKVSVDGGTGLERLNRFEQGLRKILNRLGVRITQQQIEAEGGRHERERRQCQECGEKMRNVSREPITVQSIFGPMEVRRTRYRCAVCERIEYPVDAYYGWSAHRFTPTAKEWVCLMCQAHAYDESVEILGRVTGMEGARHVFCEVVQECGGEMMRQRDERVRQINETDAPLPQGEPATSWMMVGVDGCQILKSGEMVGKRKKPQKGQEGPKQARREKRRTRRRGKRDQVPERERGMEVKVGVVGALVKNADGEYEADKKSYVSTLDKVERFSDLLFVEIAQRGVLKCEQVAVMGDGSPWIWNHITPLIPKERRVDILDWHHLEDNVEKASDALYGSRQSWAAKQWAHQQLDKLWEGKIDGVLRALTAQQRKWEHKRGDAGEKAREAIDKLEHYLQGNRARMDYPRYRQMHLPIATGEVESACKNVVGHRMKQSGMQWRAKTAEPVLYLRAEFESGRWDQKWQQLRSAA